MKLNTDRLVSLSALVVGVGSLFVVTYQTHLSRQAQYASVRPYLYIQMMFNNDGAGLLLTNSGIGPALIDDVRVRYEGKEVVGDPFDFYTGMRPDNRIPLDVDKVLPGRLIPVGATIRMIGTNGTHAPEFARELLRLFDIAEVPKAWYASMGVSDSQKATIEVTFSSVYGDRWRVRSDRIVPEGL